MGLDIPQHSDQGIKMQHKINTCAKVVCDVGVIKQSKSSQKEEI